MKDEASTEIIEGLKEAKIDFVVMMPDSEFSYVQKKVLDDKTFKSVITSNESIGVSIGAGAWIGGKKPALLIPTAGLLVASWPLTSLSMAFEVPMVILIPYRGDIGDPFWYMGVYKYTTEATLNTLQIPYTIVSKISEIREKIKQAQISSTTWLKPIAVLLTGETIW